MSRLHRLVPVVRASCNAWPTMHSSGEGVERCRWGSYAVGGEDNRYYPSCPAMLGAIASTGDLRPPIWAQAILGWTSTSSSLATLRCVAARRGLSCTRVYTVLPAASRMDAPLRRGARARSAHCRTLARRWLPGSAPSHHLFWCRRCSREVWGPSRPTAVGARATVFSWHCLTMLFSVSLPRNCCRRSSWGRRPGPVVDPGRAKRG